MLPERIWRGTYFDGHTAARYAVEVHPGAEGLEIFGEGVGALTWRYDTIRETPGLNATDPVSLECGGELPEVLVIDDPRVLDAIHAIAPTSGRKFAKRGTGFFSPRRAIAGAAAIVFTLLVAYFWGIPVLADRLTERVPVSWEEGVGRSVTGALMSAVPACDNPASVAALDRLVARLTADGRGGPYTYRVSIIDDSLVNALAAPGGYVVVFRGMIDRANSGDEIAGVLAHEIQHVVQRHGTRAILRDVPLQLIGATLSQSAAVNVVTTIGSYRYGRADERAADRDGVRMLREARISPDGLIAFFERLRADEARGGAEPPAYLSTHPSTAARIAALKDLASGASYATEPALSAAEWEALRRPCRVR